MLPSEFSIRNRDPSFPVRCTVPSSYRSPVTAWPQSPARSCPAACINSASAKRTSVEFSMARALASAAPAPAKSCFLSSISAICSCRRHIPRIVGGQFLEGGHGLIETARRVEIDRQRAAHPGIVVGQGQRLLHGVGGIGIILDLLVKLAPASRPCADPDSSRWPASAWRSRSAISPRSA